MTWAQVLNHALSTTSRREDQRGAAWAQTQVSSIKESFPVVEVGSYLTLESPAENDLKDLHPSYPGAILRQRLGVPC